MTYRKLLYLKVMYVLTALFVTGLFLSQAMLSLTRRYDMAVQTVIPSSNVLAVDIRDTLNNQGMSVGNDLVSFFTQSANVWAKYKPFRYGVNLGVTEAIRKEASFGVGNIPYFTNTSNMASFMYDNSATPTNGASSSYFTHLLPTGGSGSPYRLEDFVGYYADATPPIGQHYTNEMMMNSSGNIIPYFVLGNETDYTLKLKDLNINQYIGNAGLNIDNWYLGICFVNASKKLYMTQSTLLSQVNEYGASFNINSFGSHAGTYTVFAFISNTSIPSLTTSPLTTGYFIPLTFTKSTLTVNAFSAGIELTSFQAWKDTASSNRTVYFSYTLQNTDNTQYVSSSVNVKVYNSSGTQIGNTNLSNVTLTANSSKTVTGSVDVGSLASLNKANNAVITIVVANKTITGNSSVSTSKPK